MRTDRRVHPWVYWKKPNHIVRNIVILFVFVLAIALAVPCKADGRMIELQVPVYQTIIIEVVSETEEEVCFTVDDEPEIHCFTKEEE